MILTLATLLLFQLMGEVITRWLHLGLPGPVVGMALIAAAFALFPAFAAWMRTTVSGLLAHLSLLFVPAGVGVVQHWDKFEAHALSLGGVLILSVAGAITAGALTFKAVNRALGYADEAPE
ncbi:hypothetical protein AQS8620_00349 [Aquimixticola soesokkakensis]|uniref:Holin-like protein n=1 Tax=Aquimixticola soesokkakensis TaxID=1519096 RepID=A0A1Y5RHU2_9RHOB|nr:CidA/LrgA family protein [Aquimixticola soesokkakensis]SLN16878.1 hypothetical protein AQS8620_00349 [Aquimixticola soesokkakensis]